MRQDLLPRSHELVLRASEQGFGEGPTRSFEQQEKRGHQLARQTRQLSSESAVDMGKHVDRLLPHWAALHLAQVITNNSAMSSLPMAVQVSTTLTVTPARRIRLISPAGAAVSVMRWSTSLRPQIFVVAV